MQKQFNLSVTLTLIYLVPLTSFYYSYVYLIYAVDDIDVVIDNLTHIFPFFVIDKVYIDGPSQF